MHHNLREQLSAWLLVAALLLTACAGPQGVSVATPAVATQPAPATEPARPAATETSAVTRIAMATVSASETVSNGPAATPSSTAQRPPAATWTVTRTATRTATVRPAATETATAAAPTQAPLTPTPQPVEPSAAEGAALWPQVACSSCHGASAQGGAGPRLAGTGISFDQLLSTVRLGKGGMPAFGESQISDTVLGHIHAWLRSLARPAPTPIARPSFPTQALSEMWYYVNEMRIRADFAKDLPVRQAADDAGRLAIVHTYAGDGLVQADAVLARAGQALSEVPLPGVQAIIQQVIAETNTVADLFRQAQAEGSYAAAWSRVAQAVYICRLDTLPRATQAVRDAGLTGTVRILVVNQAGRPISGALATALSAHTPLAARTDASGRATFYNVAAVPALPIKAYAEGYVYHEINANVAAGATVDGTIALPAQPGGVAPSVSNASVSPGSGSGSAVVMFSLTATDPQGTGDLAEDQIFALNPDLGLAYVLRATGGDSYRAQVQLPGLGTRRWTWYLFAVDHECNTSNINTVAFEVSP